jgi:hypothetical protein
LTMQLNLVHLFTGVVTVDFLSIGFGQRGADDDAEGVVSGEVSVMRGALTLIGFTIRVGLGPDSA